MKCAACGAGKLRKTERAIVLTGPGRLRPGRVCRACASTGWLLVLGDAEGGTKRVRERAAKARERSALVQELIAQAQQSAAAARDIHDAELARELGVDKPSRGRR